MLLAHLILDFEPPLVDHLHNRWRLESEFGKAFSAFNARDTQVCTQVEVRLELSLGHSYLEGPSSCDRRYFVGPCRCDLPAGRSLIGDLPACHRDLQGSHEMGTLVEVTFERDRVVAWIEGARQRRQFWYADQPQIFPCTEPTVSIISHR